MTSNIVKTTADLQNKKVRVKLSSRDHHIGVVLGEDKVFKDVILVGIISSTLMPGAQPTSGKYLSVFRASRKQLEIL